MKKIAFSLVALAALSSAALASERTDIDPRDRATAVESTYSSRSSSNDSAAFTTAGEDGNAGRSAYERLWLQSQENENGGN